MWGYHLHCNVTVPIKSYHISILRPVECILPNIFNPQINMFVACFIIMIITISLNSNDSSS